MAWALFRRQSTQLWIGIGLSVLFLFLAIQGVSWSEFGDSLQRVAYPLVFLSVVSILASFVVMAYRWRILLYPAGKFSFQVCLAFLMIGYLANSILPLRAGEVIRPALFGKRTGARGSAVFATVVVERLVDMVALASLIGLLTVTMQVPTVVRDGAILAGASAVLVLGGLWTVSRRKRLNTVAETVLNALPLNLRTKITSLAESFLAGLGTLHLLKEVREIAVYSLLAWAVAVLGMGLMLAAFGLSLPWYAPIFVVVVSNLGMMIPSSPGFVGVAHFLYVFALSVFGVDRSIALSFAIVQHGLTYAITVAIGLLFLWQEGIALAQLSAAGRSTAAK